MTAFASDRLLHAHAVNEFYQAREGQPFWTTPRGFSYPGKVLFFHIEQAWSHGLNPAHYHHDKIVSLKSEWKTDEDRNRLEHLMTDAFFRYGQDMTGMRVDGKGLRTNTKSWRQSLDTESLTEILLSESNIGDVFETIQPHSRTYEILQRELQHLYKDTSVNNNERIKQLVVNLERLRWLEPEKTRRHIVVNIPSARLWAVDDGQLVHEMPVVVGRKTRPTYSFVSAVKGVRINPTWTVPVTIKKEDILPKAKADPNYFQNKGMEIIEYTDGIGRTLDPTAIEWETITPSEFAALTLVQTPGSHNPLGNMRVLMSNPYDIYLHGTNRQDQFSSEKRTLSSGCVRVQEPALISDFILQGDERYKNTPKGKTRDILVDNDISVYIYYFTTWIDEDGQVVYGPDLYDLDKRLLEKLEKIDGFVLPVHNEAVLAQSAKS